jgi:hypothetical protein
LWSGENDANDSVGTNDGKPVNVTFTKGIAGRAFHLNGSNAYVQIPDSAGLKPTDITVEAWVKFDVQASPRASLPGQQVVVFKLNTRNPRRGNFTGYSLLKDVNQFAFSIGSPDGLEVSAYSITVPQVGEWYHLAGTYDSFGSNVEVYVNGVLEGGAYAGFPLDCGTNPVFIGTTHEWWDCRLEGTVDEVAIYNRRLTVDEIHADYETVRARSPQLVQSAPTSAITDPARANTPETVKSEPSAVSAREGLVARWPAAENSSDSAGTNAPLLTHVMFAQTEGGRAFVFNGSNASIRIPAGRSLDVGVGDGFTVAVWIKPESPSLQSIWEWNQDNGVRSGTRQIGPHMEINESCGSGSLFGGIVDTDGITHCIQTTNDVISLNCFQHVAMTYDKASGIGALYRNGLVVARVNLGSFTPQTSFDFFIGNRPSGFFTGIFFQGQMDEIAIYGRALTAAEIQAGYDAGGRKILRSD